jgi:hypothetical protein
MRAAAMPFEHLLGNDESVSCVNLALSHATRRSMWQGHAMYVEEWIVVDVVECSVVYRTYCSVVLWA